MKAAHESALGDTEASTRAKVLGLIVEDGPVSVTTLADQLGLTTAAVRRHVSALLETGKVEVRSVAAPGPGRGRPSRRYVATAQGQAALPTDYSGLAAQALQFLRDNAGPGAVVAFAEDRLDEFEARDADIVTAPDVAGRAQQLADALSRDGYVASVRPVPGGQAIQLCQGHCPVQHVAAEFPEFCEAEARVFARLIGTHTQRLVTLAAGGHVCTTNVPTVQTIDISATRPGDPAPSPATT